MTRRPGPSNPGDRPLRRRAPAGAVGALSPSGTTCVAVGAPADPDAAAAFARLAAAAEACDLGAEAAGLVSELLDVGGGFLPGDREALGLLLLASMGAVRDGSTRLTLDRAASSRLGKRVADLLAGGGIERSPQEVLKAAIAAVRHTGFHHLVGRGDDAMPLILDGDWLYHQRLWFQEGQAAARIAGLGAATSELPDRHRLDEALQDVCARPPVRNGVALSLDDDQREAVRRAVVGPLAVITGGPGTGKTAIVVSILRVLHRLRPEPGVVALAAPTGKAANRMTASIRAALAMLPASGGADAAAAPADAALAAALAAAPPTSAGSDAAAAPADAALAAAPPTAGTLHRLLGYLPAEHRFRHDEHNPLAASWVIVDEASMIDLALARSLLAALRPGARLILLGDADQLPSVDAGAVLRDLLAAADQGAPSIAAARLVRSYRMDPADPNGRAILSAARAINEGRSSLLFDGDASAPARAARRSAPQFLRYEALEWLDVATPAELAAFLDAWYAARIAGAPDFARLAARVYPIDRTAGWGEAAADLLALLAIHERSRLLAVTRGLPTGSGALNRHLHARALAGATLAGRPAFYPGEPVMMTRNDYERGLFNGDQGVIVRVAEAGGPQRFRAVFPRSGDRGTELAAFHLDALRSSLELAYAVTVHKSQGAELDAIALVLPSEPVPLLTRELIYTAITRARRSVVLVGQRERLHEAAKRTIERDSGLADRVIAAARPR